MKEFRFHAGGEIAGDRCRAERHQLGECCGKFRRRHTRVRVARIAFAKRVALMASIDPGWAEKSQDEISRILVSSPYNDKV
ncbi:hypothetical protein [Pandoraea sp. NPDC087047]|uniref:hypothetical protein n=1 Tax=Pandoraea sp. NPDC087047 TaxID=3364390 RepID=UPI0038249814